MTQKDLATAVNAKPQDVSVPPLFQPYFKTALGALRFYTRTRANARLPTWNPAELCQTNSFSAKLSGSLASSSVERRRLLVRRSVDPRKSDRNEEEKKQIWARGGEMRARG